MTNDIIYCPRCQSEDISRNGRNGRGKQSYKCRDCGRKFVLNPGWSALNEEQKALIDRLLLERLSLAGIARVMQRSEDCIQRYVTCKTEQTSQTVEVTPKEKKH